VTWHRNFTKRLFAGIQSRFGLRQEQTPRETLTPPLFDQSYYSDITQARIEHLRNLHLPFRNKRVIDVGCGIGRFCDFFLEQGCTVFCVDGREQNIQTLRQLYPSVQCAVVDLEKTDLTTFGKFDIVFCYGFLYHLSNPLGFIQNASKACSEFMILETCITDAEEPILRLVDEDPENETQALHGIGCRPSPSYVANCLKLSGFKYIYTPFTLPKHPQFQYSKENNFTYIKNKENIRDILVGSHNIIINDHIRQI
jgi:SAM-dependent methyltransferase